MFHEFLMILDDLFEDSCASVFDSRSTYESKNDRLNSPFVFHRRLSASSVLDSCQLTKFRPLPNWGFLKWGIPKSPWVSKPKW